MDVAIYVVGGLVVVYSCVSFNKPRAPCCSAAQQSDVPGNLLSAAGPKPGHRLSAMQDVARASQKSC